MMLKRRRKKKNYTKPKKKKKTEKIVKKRSALKLSQKSLYTRISYVVCVKTCERSNSSQMQKETKN